MRVNGRGNGRLHRVDAAAGAAGAPLSRPLRRPLALEITMSPVLHSLCLAGSLAAALVVASPASAQDASSTVIVSIYRVAPGKQLEFLRWMAAREALDREVGVAATQWYAHMSGDSWDYVAIGPDLDDATSDKLDGMARQRGLKVGPQAGLEFRQMIASHTDTTAAGPWNAAELVQRASQP